jgi:hypothetical protein
VIAVSDASGNLVGSINRYDTRAEAMSTRLKVVSLIAAVIPTALIGLYLYLSYSSPADIVARARHVAAACLTSPGTCDELRAGGTGRLSQAPLAASDRSADGDSFSTDLHHFAWAERAWGQLRDIDLPVQSEPGFSRYHLG